jgi:adenylate cyclase
MRAITHYEVYVVKHGRWALHARLSYGEKDHALENARALHSDTDNATQVLEESRLPEEERTIMRVVGQYGQAPLGTKGPSTDTNMAARIFMVVVNAFGIGVIATMIMAIMVSSMRESGAPGDAYNMLLFFTFAAVLLTAGLTLFKIYVPMEWVLWRGKSPESQKRAIEALLYGTQDVGPMPWDQEEQQVEEPISMSNMPGLASVMEGEPAPPAPVLETDTSTDDAAPRFETSADLEQTSFQITEAPPAAPEAPAPEAPAESLTESAAAVMESLLENERARLLAFTDEAVAALAATRPQLQAFERVGLNLYLAGAAQFLTERGSHSDKIKLELLHKALVHSGTHTAVADAFNERLDTASNRPRFRNLIEAGKAAMMAKLEENPNAELTPLPDLITQWADPTVRGAEVKKVTFLLTDIVGSTALTSKLGNSAAQRVVRAHNAAARGAAKNYRGTEIKHTGDGMLLTFPDPAAACRAAMEIQQEGSNYARENPDAPLVMRLGVHTGEASFEEGEYYGPTLQILNGVCAAAGDNQIFCSEEAKSKAVGPVFKFEDMGKRTLKGSGLEWKVFKLNWTPKVKPQGPVEYTQIGRKAPAGAI